MIKKLKLMLLPMLLLSLVSAQLEARCGSIFCRACSHTVVPRELTKGEKEFTAAAVAMGLLGVAVGDSPLKSQEVKIGLYGLIVGSASYACHLYGEYTHNAEWLDRGKYLAASGFGWLGLCLYKQ